MSTITKTKEEKRGKKTQTIAQTMHAIAIDRFGGPEVLVMHTLPVPEIGKNEVLIEIDTAGVGSWDAEMRAGWWPDGRPTFPLVLGTDGSGRVAAMRLAYPNGVQPEPKRNGIRITAYDAVPGVREFEHLGMALEAAKLQVPIAQAFPLSDAAKAHARIERGLGKIVLRIR